MRRLTATVMAGAAVLGVMGWSSACQRGAARACAPAHPTFAARYVLEVDGGTGPCAELRGERLSVKLGPDEVVLMLVAEKHQVGVNEGVVVDESGTLMKRVDPDSSHTIVAMGPLTSAVPDEEGLCTVSTLSEARQDWGPLVNPDGGEDFAPQETSVYRWSDVRLVHTEEVPGSQLAARLAFTGNSGCEARYSVTAVAPAVSCDDGTGTASEAMCRGEGKVDARFAVSCDPVTLLCVPEGEIPALRP